MNATPRRERRAHAPGGLLSRSIAHAALLPLFLTLPACDSPWNVVGPVAGVTAAGGSSPTQEIEQTYYLGIFDPQEQLPPAVYRIRVRGQGSFITRTKFASGWVPADIVDTLNTSIRFDENGDLKVDSASGGRPNAGRRLVLFGPEGFLEAPADHRLVVVMGSSPEDYFRAINETMAQVSSIRQEQRDSAAARLILEELLRVQEERERLRTLRAAVNKEAGQ